MTLFHQTTSVTLSKDSTNPDGFKWGFEASEFDFEPNNAELRKIPVKNSSEYNIWVQFVAWGDDTWNKPTAMSKKVKVAPGSTIELSYPEGFDDAYFKSLTVYSYEVDTGTWRTTWTRMVPNSFDITVCVDKDGNYSFDF